MVEQRAEGLALADENGTLTDVSMPAEGTEAHVTLLVAEFLADRGQNRQDVARPPMTETQIAGFVGHARERYGSYWRKSAREPGAEHELARIAVQRLRKLQLISVSGEHIRPLPALARFAVEPAEIVEIGSVPPAASSSLNAT